VKEEETIILPELKKSDIDGEELAEEVLKFKEQHSGYKIKSSKKIEVVSQIWTVG